MKTSEKRSNFSKKSRDRPVISVALSSMTNAEASGEYRRAHVSRATEEKQAGATSSPHHDRNEKRKKHYSTRFTLPPLPPLCLPIRSCLSGSNPTGNLPPPTAIYKYRPHNPSFNQPYALALVSPKKKNGQGYGIYTWPNGDVFMGQWVDGVRHGGGIFRSADGREYVGSWARNVREGHGVREMRYDTTPCHAIRPAELRENLPRFPETDFEGGGVTYLGGTDGRTDGQTDGQTEGGGGGAEKGWIGKCLVEYISGLGKQHCTACRNGRRLLCCPGLSRRQQQRHFAHALKLLVVMNSITPRALERPTKDCRCLDCIVARRACAFFVSFFFCFFVLFLGASRF